MLRLRYALAAAVVLALPVGSFASEALPAMDWTASYNGPGSELEAVHGVTLRDGCLYVVGATTVSIQGTGYITVKYASDGTEAWSRTYEGFVGGTNQSDVAKAVAVDAAGNVYVTGYSAEYPTPGSQIYVDAVTLKYGPDGDLLWERRHRGSGGNVQPAAVVVDPAGFLYVTGASWIEGDFDVFLLKYDLAGTLLWSRGRGHPIGWDAATSMSLDGDGNIVLGGYTQPGDVDVYVLSYGRDGSLRWEWSLYGRADVEQVIDVAVDAEGNTYAMGEYAPAWAHTSLLTVKLDRSGTLLWSDVYSGQSTGDYGAGIELSPDGGVFTAGAAWENGSQNGMTLIKYSADGRRLWGRSERGGYYSAECNDLAVDAEGAAYMTGFGFDQNEDMQYLTAKYDGSGNRIWTASWAAPEGRTDIAYHVRVGADQRVYVVGDAWRDFARYFDITSVVYRQSGVVAVTPTGPDVGSRLLGPNPVMAGTAVTLLSLGNEPIELFGIDGRRVLRPPGVEAAREGTLRFTAPSSPGVYLVRAGKRSEKLVVLGHR